MYRSALVLVIACTSRPPPDPPPCDAPTGTLEDQVLPLGDGLEDRVYWVHVPDSYDCTAPMPLLIDFHGTASDQPTRPEEAFATDALIAFSDANHVIVARPRSRSSVFEGVPIYRWDENPGDLARNVQYADNLVAALEHRYAIDPARVYASGFSSGSNMVSQFLGDPASPFKGLAPIAGGAWILPELPSLAHGPRVFMATGYRDYLWPYARAQLEAMTEAGLPADHLEIRHGGGGHDLYAWQFDELWEFLDGGIRHGGGWLSEPWVEQRLPSPADINVLADDQGTLVAAGAGGRTWRLDGSGWTLDLDRGDADYTTLCFGPGLAMVGGGTTVIAGSPGGTWGASETVPDFGEVIGSVIGGGSINAAGCRDDGSIVVGGYWSAAITTDGRSWSQFLAPSLYPAAEAQIAAIASSPDGATVMVGYADHVARGSAGDSTAVPVVHPAGGSWWNAVTALPGGRFWAVGDDGSIIASVDDGLSWTVQSSGTHDNLFAVHFADADRGAAVGRRGTVLVTIDGGQHWTPRPTGIDSYVGAVWVDATTVWIAGEDGLIATSPL